VPTALCKITLFAQPIHGCLSFEKLFGLEDISHKKGGAKLANLVVGINGYRFVLTLKFVAEKRIKHSVSKDGYELVDEVQNMELLDEKGELKLMVSIELADSRAGNFIRYNNGEISSMRPRIVICDRLYKLHFTTTWQVSPPVQINFVLERNKHASCLALRKGVDQVQMAEAVKFGPQTRCPKRKLCHLVLEEKQNSRIHHKRARVESPSPPSSPQMMDATSGLASTALFSGDIVNPAFDDTFSPFFSPQSLPSLEFLPPPFPTWQSESDFMLFTDGKLEGN